MAKFAAAVKTLVRSEEGATMVEYGLLIAAIALVVVAGAQVFGTSLSGFFNAAAGSL
jgi:pilus assembly protein Flp/PilA